LKARIMKLRLAAVLCSLATAAMGATPNEVLSSNTQAIVYLEVTDAAGQFVDSGTGFIVSHDGYVVTAAHIKTAPGQKLWAVIAQRDGTRFPLQARERDEEHDVVLWQLPQSASCRYAVTLSTAQVHVLDRAVALGFPGRDGLTPALLNIANLSAPDTGFYKADGFLRNGYSGGPIFNEDGKVIATVHSGTPSGGNNDLVPISFALDLLKKRGTRAGVDTPVPFDNTCYTFCRAPAHGIEKWASEIPWSADSGEVPGGHNQRDECGKLIAAAIAGIPGSSIDLAPGPAGMWEDSHKDVLGSMHYIYYCKGTLRAGPIYAEKQSPACGLWN
jgi:Trypsin-like peptidase domain